MTRLPLGLGLVLLAVPWSGAQSQCVPGGGPGFDFTPAGRVLFATDFSGATDFPAGLELKQGAIELSLWDGKPALKASSPSALLIPLGETLPDQFTLEVDVVNRNTKQVGAPTIKIYGGRAALSDFATGATRISVGTGFWEVSGGGANAQAAMPTGTSDECVGQLMTVRLAVDGPRLKVYADGRRLASLPSSQFLRARGLVLGLEGRDPDDNAVYVTSIRLAGGPPAATTAVATPTQQTTGTAPPASGTPVTSTTPTPTPTPTTAAPTTATPTTAASASSSGAVSARTTATPTTQPVSAKTGIAAATSLTAPIGISAEYIGAGRFAVAWSPVPGAAEYEVYAKSSACDCKISMPALTDTTFVPTGTLDYPGPISIYIRALDGGGGISPNSAPVIVRTPRHWGAYRITVDGVRVNRETLDDPLQIDGKRDEIIVTASVQEYDRDGNRTGQGSVARTKVHGDVDAPAWSTATSPQVRIKAGTASLLGGLKTGDVIQPSGEPTTISFPLKVWEGILREESITLAIVPIVWEVDRTPSWEYKPLDDPGQSLLMSVGERASKRIRPMLSDAGRLTTQGLDVLRRLSGQLASPYQVAPLWAVQAAISKGFQASIPLITRYNIRSDTLQLLAEQRSAAFESFYQTLGTMNLTSPVTDGIASGLTQFYNTWSPTLTLLLNHADRPIGLRLVDGQTRLFPHIVKLDFESVEALLAAGALGTSGPGIIEVRYTDQITGGNGDYSIYLKVERLQ
jgi:hypothetical protein